MLAILLYIIKNTCFITLKLYQTRNFKKRNWQKMSNFNLTVVAFINRPERHE